MATAAAVGLASTAIVAAGGGSAAAADLPNAQSVGRLVDGALGGNPIQSVADVKDARATAPGSTSVQKPLDATALNAINLPLTGAIKLPTSPAVQAGVANQVASANLNGASRGATGAVSDDGGALLGNGTGDDVDPSFGSVNLNGTAFSAVPIPALPTIPGLPTGLPGGTNLAALGGVTATLGALYSKASTAKGGDVITPSSGIAGLDLSIGSPALGALLQQLTGVLNPAVLTNSLSGIPGLSTLLATLPSGSASMCALTNPNATIPPLAGGGVTISPSTGTITVHLRELVKQLLNVDIQDPSTSNFDLISFLVKNLPTILSTGLTKFVTSITDPLKMQFTACTGLLGPLGAVAAPVVALINTAQTTLTNAITSLSSQFSTSASGPLGTLASGLGQIVDIGLNVQSGPGIQKKDTVYPFDSNLEATPNQSTPVVEKQTLVRAIEIQVLKASAAGLPAIPNLAGNSAKVRQLAGNAAAARPLALAPGDGLLNVALANSAAGPSAVDDATTTPSTSAPATVVPDTDIPTGIPAGQAAGSHDDGLPVLPLVAILMLLAVSGGAFWQYRMRGLHQG